MTVIRKIEHVQSIKFRKKNGEMDVEIIKKSGDPASFLTLPALRYSPIYLEGKMQLDAEKGLILFEDATCTVESSVFGPVMTCKDTHHALLDVP